MELLLFAVVLTLAVLLFLGRRYRGQIHSAYDEPRTPPVIADHEVSDAHATVVAKLGAFTRTRSRDVAVSRQQFEDFFTKEVAALISPVDVNGIPGEWVLAAASDPSHRLLYLHGGAFTVGSPRSHRYLTAALSERTGVAVLAVDYRMLPEFKTRDCHADARKAYSWILENGPEGPGAAKSLFVAGDSAGGNLTLSTIAWARDSGRPPAQAAIAFAPLTDATMASPTWRSNLATDPFLGPGFGPMLKVPRFVIHFMMRLAAGAGVHEPMLSPLQGNLRDLPPTLIQVSRDEMLYGDAQRYANKANHQGGDVTLQVWPKMVHVFQGFPELPEAQDALSRAAAFIISYRDRVGS